MKTYYVYILLCSDYTFYTGITNDVYRRYNEHQEGIDEKSYTFTRRPVKLVFFLEFTEVQNAIDAEKRIQKWSKAKKMALIRGNFDLLKVLSKKKFKK